MGADTNITSGVSGSHTVVNLACDPTLSAFYVTEGNSAQLNLKSLTPSGTLSAQIGTPSEGNVTIYSMVLRPNDNALYAFDYYAWDSGRISPTTVGWTVLNSIHGCSPPPLIGLRYALLNDTIYMIAIASGNGFFEHFFVQSDRLKQKSVYKYGSDLRLHIVLWYLR